MAVGGEYRVQSIKHVTFSDKFLTCITFTIKLRNFTITLTLRDRVVGSGITQHSKLSEDFVRTNPPNEAFGLSLKKGTHKFAFQ